MNSLPIRSMSLSARMAHSAAPYLSAFILLLAGLVPCSQAVAATELKDVQFSALPGNEVRIDLTLSGPVKPPGVFSTESPARIVLDFEGVKSALAKRSVPIGIGPVQGLAAVEAGDRTRVVVDLSKAVPYQVDTRGDQVYLSINGAASAAPRSSSQRSARTKQRSVRTKPSSRGRAEPGAIRDIDFQRGPGREGRVKITLPSRNTAVSVTEKGTRVIADIKDASIPPRLVRRLDVTDFGTPVISVESVPKGKDTQVDIQTTSEYDYLAYQADDQFVLEFRPVSKAKKRERDRRNKVYTGDRLSLNFQNIEVRAVLQLLADFTGLNLVASDTVRGNITLRLKNVPWDQALDIILKSKGLSMRRNGNVIMVAPTQEIAAQEKLELQADNDIRELAPLHSEFIQINYAKASELAKILKAKDNKLLSERGHVTVDPRTNTLLVEDTGAKLEDIRRMITKLDVPVRQVMIESRVVIANNDFARDIGVQFGVNGSVGREGHTEALVSGGSNAGLAGNIPGTADINTGPFMQSAVTGLPYNSSIENPSGSGSQALMVNLPAVGATSGMAMLLGKVGSYLVQLELTAMQQEGRGEIISSPRVITSDQHQAVIKMGQQIPYQTVSQNGTNVQFKDAVLELDVTPHITPDSRIIMDLLVKKDEADYSRSINGEPPLNTNAVTTSVLVDNGETVVLGGVYERTKTFSKKQVPWLGDLPVVGNLFKEKANKDNNSELLIFVTPKILKQELVNR
jgi:type IV pilus assembly protein PilQ